MTVVTFGEIMLRLSPPGFERLFQSPVLSATFGGGEANVAVSLAQFDVDSVYVTRVPPHAIGDAAVRALRADGVRTDYVVRGGSRLGIYFTETGASQRASTVIYDRAHSAISEMSPDDVRWDDALAGASWLHLTGITPALGDRARTCTRAAIAFDTKTGSLPVTPSIEATIHDEPADTPTTTPFGDTAATDGSVEDHETLAPTSTFPDASRTMAVA